MTTEPTPSVSKAHPTIARTIEIFWHQKAKRPQAVWDCDHLSRKAKDVAKRRWMASLSVSLALPWLQPTLPALTHTELQSTHDGYFSPLLWHVSFFGACFKSWLIWVEAQLQPVSDVWAQLGLAFPNIPMNSSSEASGNDVMLNGKLWTWTRAQAGTIGNMVNFKNDQRKKLHKKNVHAITI